MAKSKLKDYIYQPEYECLSRSEMENLQSERLKKTVKYVYEHCKPYRAKMDEFKIKPSDIRSVSDLSKLPFTVKHDLRAAYPFGFYSADQKDIVEVHASSGTTGKLTVVGYTQNDIDIWAEVAARSLAMAGVTKDSLVHVAYGYGLFTGGLGAHYGAQKIGASTVPASAGNTIRQLTLLRDFGATHLCCTPSYAIFLGTEIEKAGMNIDDFSLVGGAFGAEPWTYQMREELERLLHIRCARSWSAFCTSTRWISTGFRKFPARASRWNVCRSAAAMCRKITLSPKSSTPKRSNRFRSAARVNWCSRP